MFSGRARAAIALAEKRDERPTGISDSELDSFLGVAHAIDSRAPTHVEGVMTQRVACALRLRCAENAIQYAWA